MTFSSSLSGDRMPMIRYRGITLVEMLVALAVTLLMMGAVISVFGFIGEHVTDRRSMIETNDRLRSAAFRLREDLSSLTVAAVPWQRPEAEQGYLEILEGRQAPTQEVTNDLTRIVGDIDDILMFTVRTKGSPYRGKFNTSFVESNTAEVVWYLRRNTSVVTNPPTYLLCRRLMLIVPQAVLDTGIGSVPVNDRPKMVGPDFYELFDVSARVEGEVNGTPPRHRVANTLGDLTKRENRFAHNLNPLNAKGFPFPVRVGSRLVDGIIGEGPAQGFDFYPAVRSPYKTRDGEEVVLSNVLAFNVQVYDPHAYVRGVGDPPVATEPSDPGYIESSRAPSSPPARLLTTGAYIDLGDENAAIQPGQESAPDSPPGGGASPKVKAYLAAGGYLASTGHPQSGLVSKNNGNIATYDTWSFHYEQDGIQQSTAAIKTVTDAGTNGLDDNSKTNPGVDDISERETSPPYPVPLRGLRVKIRVYEPSSKQVRETTVVQSFVPE